VRSFTPAYAAPEQIRGEAVTAATDVYQLGLVLKGLIGGEPVPADLQAIVAKALRADPASRYATAEALRRDLEDFLEGRPVAAFSAATGYRVRKWIERYRVAVSAVGAVVLALALGLIGVTLQSEATARARDRAATAERRVSAVNEFVLHELLEAPMPEVAMGRDLTVAEVLGNASRSVEHVFQGQPAVEAEVRLTLAHTYAALGRYKDAAEHARAAKLLLAGAPDLAPGLLDRAERTLASLAIDDGKFDQARTSLEALYARQVAARGPSDEEALLTSAELGRALKGTFELARAEQVLREAAALARRDRPDDWRLSIEIDRTLSDVLALSQQGIESEALARSVLDTMGRHLGVDHPERVRALMQLAIALNLELRYPESSQAIEEALTLSRKVFGSDHPMTAEVLTQKALSEERLSHYDGAVAAVKEALEIRRKALGPQNPRTLVSLYQLGVLTANAGRPEEAIPIFVEVVEGRATVLGESYVETIRAMKSLNIAYLRVDREAEARAVGERMTRAYETVVASPDADPERLDQFAQHLMTIRPKDLQDAKRALGLAERAVAATGRTRWSMLRTLGDAYAETGRSDLAIAAMQEALALPDGLRSWSTTEVVVGLLRDEKRDAEIEPFLIAHRDRQLAASHPDERMVAKTERVLALHLVKSGRPKDADPYFAQAEGRFRRVLPAGNWEIGRLLSDWGACRTELRVYPEAERLLLDGYEILAADMAMTDATAAARDRLAKLYEAWGKPGDAKRWRQ
jgi:serine/threonine-protein kinase